MLTEQTKELTITSKRIQLSWEEKGKMTMRKGGKYQVQEYWDSVKQETQK